MSTYFQISPQMNKSCEKYFFTGDHSSRYKFIIPELCSFTHYIYCWINDHEKSFTSMLKWYIFSTKYNFIPTTNIYRVQEPNWVRKPISDGHSLTGHRHIPVSGGKVSPGEGCTGPRCHPVVRVFVSGSWDSVNTASVQVGQHTAERVMRGRLKFVRITHVQLKSGCSYLINIYLEIP